MSSVVIAGDIHTLLGRRDEVVALFQETQEHGRQQSGCLEYVFAEVVSDPGHYVFVQEWRDEAAFEAHYASAAFRDYQARVTPLLARPSEARIHRVAETLHPADPGPMDPRKAD